MSYDAGKIEATIDADRTPFEQSLDAAEERARRFSEAEYKPRITIDQAAIDRQFDEITERLRRLSSDTSRPGIDIDTEPAHEKIRLLVSSLNDLDSRVARPRVALDDGPASAALIGILARLDRADRYRATPRIDLQGVAEANAQLQLLQAQLNHLNGQTATTNVNTRGSALGGGLGGISGSLSSITGLFGSATRAAGLFSLAVAAVGVASPILATLGGGVLALSGAFAAAGAGAAIFGAAAVSALKPVITARQQLTAAEKQYTNATTDPQRAAALLKEQQILQALDPAQRKILTNLDLLSTQWGKSVAAVKPEIYQIAANAIGVASIALQKLTPLLQGSAGAFQTLSNRAADVVQGPAFQGFVNFLTRNAPAAILTFGHAFGDLGSILGHVLEGFEPLIAPAERALTGFLDTVRDKAANLAQSSGFQNFLQFIRDSAPEVGRALGSIGSAFLSLLRAVEPLAAPLLGFVSAIGQAVSKLTQSQGFREFVDQLGRAFGTLGGILTSNATGIGTFLGTFGKTVADLLQALAPLAPHLVTFITNIASFIDKIITNPGFPKLVDAVGTALDKIGTAIANIPPGVISAVLGGLADLVTVVGKISSIGNGAGLLAVAAGVLALKRALAGGIGGTAGGLGISRLIVPVAVTYAVTGALGLHKELSDIINGQFAQAVQDQPKWAQTISSGLSKALNVATLGLVNTYTPDLSGVFLSGKATAALTLVTSKYGQNAAKAFQVALFNEKGNVQQAWDDVYATIKGADPSLFGEQGKKAGTNFWQGIAGQAGGAKSAGTALANAARDGSIWTGAAKTNGTTGGTNFWQGIFGQKGNTANAAAGLASAAKAGSIWSGLSNGGTGAVGFWQGINNQQFGAAVAAGGLATAARNGSIWTGAPQGGAGAVGFWQAISSQQFGAAVAGSSLAGAAASNLGAYNGWAWNSGLSLGQNFAAGIVASAGSIAAAAGAAAAAAAGAFPRSPAKFGPFSGANHPEALGRKLISLYATGMRAAIPTIGHAAHDSALAARISGASRVAAGSSSTAGSRMAGGAPVEQHFHGVGPDVVAAVNEANRQRDFLVGA